MLTDLKKLQAYILAICILMTTSPLPAFAEEATTVNAADIQKELDSAKAGQDSQQNNIVQTAQSQGGDGFRFGGQIDGFSLNYLVFLSQYMAGAAMPALCRNAMAGTDITGSSLALPYINIDNIIYAISSLIYLFVEILSFERIQKKKAQMDQFIADLKAGGVENQGSGSGDQATNRANKKDHENLQITAVKAQRDLLAEQIRILYFKEDAIRATKAGWLLSALVSSISYVIWYTGVATAGAAGYMYPVALASVGVGASATAATGAVAAGAVGAGVAVGVGAGAAASGQSPLASVGMGLLAGSAVPGLATSIMGTVMGMPDLCAPFSVLAAGTAAGAWFNDNFFQIQQSVRGGQEALNKKNNQSSNENFNDFKTYVLPKIKLAANSSELATALMEAQLMQKGAVQNVDPKIGQELHKNIASTISSKDVLLMRDTISGYYTKGLQGVVAAMFPEAQATTDNSNENMPPPSSGAPPAMEDPITGFSNDVDSVVNTGNNLSSLSKDSEYLKDINSAKDAGELLSATLGKFLTFDFIKKFASWLGFKNGGEIMLFFFLSAVIDLAIMPARAVVVVPPIPITAYAGFFPGRIISSLVGAFFANGYYGEVYEFRGKLEQSYNKLNALIAAMEAKAGLDTGPNISGAPKGQGNNSSGTAVLSGDNNKAAELCINGGELNPAAIGNCPANGATENDISKNFENPAFAQGINLPEVNGGLALNGLSDSFNKLSVGNSKGARSSLQNLGSQANAISKRLKKIIDTANEKLPEAKVNETLSSLAKDQIQLLRNSFKIAGVEFDRQAKILPFVSAASATSLAAVSTESANADNTQALAALLKKNADQIGPAKNPWGNTLGNNTSGKNTELANYSDEDVKEALKNNYEYNNNDAINPDAEKDIFKAITIRYFKTAYPQLLNKKNISK